MQPMFNQPMGAFDISGAWQAGQPAVGGAQQQWMGAHNGPAQALQQVQFVPNPTFIQQMPIQPQHHQPQQQLRQQRQLHHQQQMQQRSMHQRSLSAPRLCANGLKRPMNQNIAGNVFPGQKQQNWNRQSKSQQQQQQSRMNNNSTNNSRNNRGAGVQANSNAGGNSHQQNNQHKQSQQQRSNQTKQSPRNGGPAKVTKAAKKQIIDQSVRLTSNNNSKNARQAKLGVKQQAKQSKPASDANVEAKGSVAEAVASDKATPATTPSKTAVRKKLKLEARKNAEALSKSKLPVVKATKQVADTTTDVKLSVSDANQKSSDEPSIDQAQLKCVPAVFGFVCKLCDVFLRDKAARREHIDSDNHMEKFRDFEQAESKRQQEEQAEQVDVKVEVKDEDDDVKGEVELKAEVKEEVKQDDESQQPEMTNKVEENAAELS